MLDMILVSGISGLLIILMVMGIGKIVLIGKKRKEGHTLRESTHLVLGNSIGAWFLTIYALLVISMLMLGLLM